MRKGKSSNKKQTKRVVRVASAQQAGQGANGTMSKAPRVFGSQQVSARIQVKEQVQRRVITGVFDLVTGTAGNFSLQINTASLAPPAPVTVGTIATVASFGGASFASYDLYRIRKVQLIFEPNLPITTATGTLYAAYDAINPSPSGTLNVAGVVKYQNYAQFLTREPASLTYNIKNVSADNFSVGVLPGGWIDISQITTSGLNGFIALYGTNLAGSANLINFGRLEIRALVELKQRVN